MSKTKGWQNIPDDNVIQPLTDIEILKKALDLMPYPVIIFDHEGTTVYVNEANKNMFQYNPEGVIGKYNVFNDPTILAAMPYEKLKQVFKGETVFFPAVKVPLKDLAPRDNSNYDMEALYNDITYYPIIKGSRLQYIVALQVPCRVYQGKMEIEKAKEYIENNWFEKFILKDVLAVSGLSKTHFTRLFKQYTGTTAHEYYINIKINNLKEKLIDPNISVNQAFNECNWDHNGHFTKVFKDRVGMSPSEYRQKVHEK